MLAASLTTAGIGVGVAFAAAAAGSKCKPIVAQTTPPHGFDPKSHRQARRTVVYFTNKDRRPARRGRDEEDQGQGGLQLRLPEDQWLQRDGAKTPGTYAYICTVHPFMKGTLVVKK